MRRQGLGFGMAKGEGEGGRCWEVVDRVTVFNLSHSARMAC